MARHLTRSANGVKMSIPEEFADSNVEEIILSAKDSLKLNGWYLKNTSSKAVLLLSGIRGNKLGQIKRAQFFFEQGYNVLLLDLRGTGESEGKFISFGFHEAKDVEAAFQFLVEKGNQEIGADGISLGAAALAFSINATNFDWLVLESCYDNIDNAFKNRVSKFKLPLFAYEPIKFFVSKRVGAKPKSLYPIKELAKADMPILILAGDKEKQIKVQETLAIFNVIPHQHKSLYFFKNAGHVDFWDFDASNYKSEVKLFLNGME